MVVKHWKTLKVKSIWFTAIKKLVTLTTTTTYIQLQAKNKAPIIGAVNKRKASSLLKVSYTIKVDLLGHLSFITFKRKPPKLTSESIIDNIQLIFLEAQFVRYITITYYARLLN